MNALILQNTIWRSGIVLKSGGNTALIKADTEDRKIYISVSGTENTRRDFLSAIRAQFDSIHKTIAKIDLREKVPVPNSPNVVVDYEHLLTLERKGIKEFIPEGMEELVNVQDLLNGVMSDIERRSPDALAMNQSVQTIAQDAQIASTNKTRPTNKLIGALVATLRLPKYIGRFVFDLFGRHESAESSSIIFGWVLIIIATLILRGFITSDRLLEIFREVWRFFNPVK